jgi:hypothetical protein
MPWRGKVHEYELFDKGKHDAVYFYLLAGFVGAPGKGPIGSDGAAHD